MAIKIELLKRPLKTKPGRKPQFRWHIRWRDSAGKRWCESTGTGDRVQAEAFRSRRWQELNGLIPVAVPEPQRLSPTWDDCRTALDRALVADNLRPSYVTDMLLTLEGLRRMFPETKGPADVTADMANEYKRRRSEAGHSPWTIRGDLATLKAAFGKWLAVECGLLDEAANPFKSVRPPRCDDPEVRIVSAAEQADLFAWMNERWNRWHLPLVYLRVAALLGWRATEIASIREEDLLADGFVRVVAATSKTRKIKMGWLPDEQFSELQACAAGGFAFGRFPDELRRLLLLWRRQPNHAARVRKFAPERLVGWMQDELQRFNREKARAIEAVRANGGNPPQWSPFTLHDFRRTAITGMQMAGVSEKEASVMVGATPEVIRRHYEQLDKQAIARRNVERRLRVEGSAG